MHRDEAGSVAGRSRIRWNAYRAAVNLDAVVRRSPQVAAICAVLGLDAMADRARVEAALESVWAIFRDSEILLPLLPGEYVLPEQALTVVRPAEWWLCDACGALTPWRVSDRCLMPGCAGKMKGIWGTTAFDGAGTTKEAGSPISGPCRCAFENTPPN